MSFNFWFSSFRNDQNEGKIVVYSRINKSIVVCDYPESSSKTKNSVLRNQTCPLCHRSESSNTRFMHPEYFRSLEEMHNHDDDQESSKNASSFITGYYQKFFIEAKKLGTGSFWSVFLCKHVLNNVDLGTYAIKKIVLSDDPAWQKRVFREVRLLERVHHPNIIEHMLA